MSRGAGNLQRLEELLADPVSGEADPRRGSQREAVAETVSEV